jgi:hypothetical protein
MHLWSLAMIGPHNSDITLFCKVSAEVQQRVYNWGRLCSLWGTCYAWTRSRTSNILHHPWWTSSVDVYETSIVIFPAYDTSIIIDSKSEICALLGCYAASCGNSLLTFRDNVSFPPSKVRSPRRKERPHAVTYLCAGSCGRWPRITKLDANQWGWTSVREGGHIRCPETSVNNYHSTLRNISEERGSHRHCGGSLKSDSKSVASIPNNLTAYV